MKHTLLALILFLPIAAASMRAASIEHPGILHKEDDCSSCHRDKTSGKSVHSAMELLCTTCHLAETQGDMTKMSLVMPKEQICFSCHEQTMLLTKHSLAGERLCVDCHDSHSSSRRMLLRVLNTRRSDSPMLPAGRKTSTRKITSQP